MSEHRGSVGSIPRWCNKYFVIHMSQPAWICFVFQWPTSNNVLKMFYYFSTASTHQFRGWVQNKTSRVLGCRPPSPPAPGCRLHYQSVHETTKSLSSHSQRLKQTFKTHRFVLMTYLHGSLVTKITFIPFSRAYVIIFRHLVTFGHYLVM